MKDFYLILQIERNASKQAIKQAYKKLARKYHPDLLSPDMREDQSLREKIQDINEAYRILSDDKKREEYDLGLKMQEDKLAEAVSPFERRSLLVRCARTKHTYKMLLARRKNTRDKFEITGFESLDKPLLTDNNWFAKISSTVLRKPRELVLKSQTANNSFQTKFYTESPIGMEDISWKKEIRCPDCESRPISQTSSIGTSWYVCGVCKQVFYTDHFMTVFGNHKLTWCPWCGKRNKLTKESHGQKWRIRGQDGSESQGKGQNLLPEEKPKALGDGKNK